MAQVQLKLTKEGKGTFYIMDKSKQIGEMVFDIKENNLTVYHTEVSPEAERQGHAKELLHAMTDYARDKSLKVIPLCTFVHNEFKKNPQLYADVWGK